MAFPAELSGVLPDDPVYYEPDKDLKHKTGASQNRIVK